MPVQNVFEEVTDGMEEAVAPSLHTNHLDWPETTKNPPAPAGTLEGAEPAKQVSRAWLLVEAPLLVPVGHTVTTACALAALPTVP